MESLYALSPIFGKSARALSPIFGKSARALSKKVRGQDALGNQSLLKLRDFEINYLLFFLEFYFTNLSLVDTSLVSLHFD